MEQLRHVARHFLNVSYHLLHTLGVPKAYIPDLVLIAIALVLTTWFVLLVLVGLQASRKGQSFWYGFFLSAFTTPILATVFVGSLRPLKTTRRGKRRASSGQSDRARERVA